MVSFNEKTHNDLCGGKAHTKKYETRPRDDSDAGSHSIT